MGGEPRERYIAREIRLGEGRWGETERVGSLGEGERIHVMDGRVDEWNGLRKWKRTWSMTFGNSVLCMYIGQNVHEEPPYEDPRCKMMVIIMMMMGGGEDFSFPPPPRPNARPVPFLPRRARHGGRHWRVTYTQRGTTGLLL